LPLEQHDFSGGGDSLAASVAATLLLHLPEEQHAGFSASTRAELILVLQVPVAQHGLGRGPTPSLLQQSG
jgi:hypothetical protein